MDFEHTRRQEVIDYVSRKYGEENVCRIVTFGTMAAKQSVKDMARVLGYPVSMATQITKMIPSEAHMTIDKAMEMNPEFSAAYQNPDVKKIVDMARKVEGVKRNSSVHACFDANTLVQTSHGHRPICEVKTGDLVLTHKGHYKKVVDTIVTETDTVYTVRASGMLPVEVTGNHPMYVLRDGEPQWIPVNELKQGDYLNMVMDRKHKLPKHFARTARKEVSMHGLEIIVPNQESVLHLQQLFSFAKHILVDVFEKDGEYHCCLRNADGAFMEKGHMMWTPLLSVEKQKSHRKMYNLTVLDDSSYTANGLTAHNCGVVLAPGPVRDFLPVSKELNKETGLKVITSQVVGPEVEELSLLKMDFLGLKNMTVIHDVIKNIKKTRGIDIDYHDIPLNDRATYQMLLQGATGGVFQLESPGMTNVVTRMLSDLNEIPDEDVGQCFERMTAAVALYRPGPMDFIDTYIDGMKNPSHVKYDCDQEESILAPTYGVMVYQEQIIKLAQVLAGYSLGRADILRKACGKKKTELMNAEHEVFINGLHDKANNIPGCVGNGIPAEVAEEIWQKIKIFANYAFNKSHAACYAYIAILTAYMRCHWAPEFYAAMCNAFHENADKLKGYLIQANKARIKILPPDINLSESGFTSDNGSDIRFGFSGLAGVKNYSGKITEERANGVFTNEQDFYNRMNFRNEKPNKKILEALTWSGAFQSFGNTKKSLMDSWSLLEKASDFAKTTKEAGQYSLFGEEPEQIDIPAKPEVDAETLMEKEKASVGFYLTNHPVDSLYADLTEEDHITILDNLPAHSCKTIKTIGVISDMKTLFTKKEGRRMFTFTLSDRFSDVRCVVFPNEADANASNISDGNIVLVDGEWKCEEDEDRQLFVRSVMGKEQIHRRKNKVVVTITSKEEQTKLLEYLKIHSGRTPVVIYANGKQYPVRKKLDVTASSIDWLRQNFSHIQSC